MSSSRLRIIETSLNFQHKTVHSFVEDVETKTETKVSHFSGNIWENALESLNWNAMYEINTSEDLRVVIPINFVWFPPTEHSMKSYRVEPPPTTPPWLFDPSSYDTPFCNVAPRDPSRQSNNVELWAGWFPLMRVKIPTEKLLFLTKLWLIRSNDRSRPRR